MLIVTAEAVLIATIPIVENDVLIREIAVLMIDTK